MCNYFDSIHDKNVYGTWPASGEIDLMESCGNRHLNQNGRNIGPEQVGQTLHFGPKPSLNGFLTSHYTRNSPPGRGYHLGFHRYQMEWCTLVRDSGWSFSWCTESLTFPFTNGAFRPGILFDSKFRCFCTGCFPDNASNPGGKPWKNNSPHAATDFWNGRHQWLPTWKLQEHHSKEASLQVDYVKIWAL